MHCAFPFGVFLVHGDSGGEFSLENCWAAGSYHSAMSVSLLRASGRTRIVECYHHSNVIYQGQYMVTIGNDPIRAILGSQWSLDGDGRLQLTPSASRTDLANPRFNGVVVSAATADAETACADLVGNTSPVALNRGGRTALAFQADGTLYRPSSVNSCRAWLRPKAAGAERYAIDLGNAAVAGDLGAVPVAGYEFWAAENGVSGGWGAQDALGVRNVFRYAFNRAKGAFEDPPLLSISFDGDGRPVVGTPPLMNEEGFAFSILATEDAAGTSNAVDYALDPSGSTAIPDPVPPARFFRLKATEAP